MPKEKSNVWLLRIIIFLGLVSGSLIGFAIYKETYKKIQVEKEIQALKDEADKIKRDNVDLTDKLSYLESKDFQEKEAKDKLNLQTEGENLVIIKPSLGKPLENSGPSEPEKAEIIIKKSNVQKWWEYFFKY